MELNTSVAILLLALLNNISLAVPNSKDIDKSLLKNVKTATSEENDFTNVAFKPSDIRDRRSIDKHINSEEYLEPENTHPDHVERRNIRNRRSDGQSIKDIDAINEDEDEFYYIRPPRSIGDTAYADEYFHDSGEHHDMRRSIDYDYSYDDYYFD